MHQYFKFSIVFLFVVVGSSYAWDQSELEIFDLVEEVNQNFYELLNVPQNCTSAEIRRAYRKTSLILHPDKNDAPDAQEKFRQLVGVYEILRDDAKRAIYDQVLVDGLPDWRQPLYYYRRYRKMGTLELSIWVLLLFTIGQYAVAWGSYFEKKLAVEELITSKLKKLQRKVKKKKQNEVDIQEKVEEYLQKPSYRNTLPFQLFNLIISLPAFYRSVQLWLEERKKEKEEQKQREKEEAEELEREKEELEREKERKMQRRKRPMPMNQPNFSNEPDACILDAVDEPEKPIIPAVKPVPKSSGGLWTDDDLADMAKYMKKYPAGTYERWEKIADALNRTVFEVTHFAKKVKENAYKPPEEKAAEESTNDATSTEEATQKKKEKTRGGKNAKEGDNGDDQLSNASNNWSQKQQKALEAALAQFPKGSLERWERIAKLVPEKTKEECMLRVKYLMEMVKKKKQQEQEAIVDEKNSQTAQEDHEQSDECSQQLTEN
nr:EOG090X0BHG [Leptodora kindtii]